MINLFKIKGQKNEEAANSKGGPPVKKQSPGELRLHKGLFPLKGFDVRLLSARCLTWYRLSAVFVLIFEAAVKSILFCLIDQINLMFLLFNGCPVTLMFLYNQNISDCNLISWDKTKQLAKGQSNEITIIHHDTEQSHTDMIYIVQCVLIRAKLILQSCAFTPLCNYAVLFVFHLLLANELLLLSILVNQFVAFIFCGNHMHAPYVIQTNSLVKKTK